MTFLALRYLLARKRQTILTILGVFFGTMGYVAVSGFFVGFQGYLVQQLVNNTAQIHIQARQDYVTEHELDKSFFGDRIGHVFWQSPPAGVSGYFEVQNPQSWYERLDTDPRVVAYSPLMMAPALFTLSNLSVSASLIGCDPDKQAMVTSIADYMVAGKFSDIGAGGNRLILGEELMKQIGAGLDEVVQVSVGTNRPAPFKIIGYFSTGNRFADLQAYGSLNDVQQLNRTPNRVTEIGVRLKDYTQAAALATSWSQIAPERTESWDQQNAHILAVFRIQNALRFSMILTVLVVAGFGIYNVLNMTVTQKRQDIAILRSMGYDTFDIVMLFFSQGFILGVVGAAFGLIAGYLFCLYLQTIPFMAANPMNPSGRLHIAFSVSIYIEATLMALLSASFASVLPARAAGKLPPIEVIRSGG